MKIAIKLKGVIACITSPNFMKITSAIMNKQPCNECETGIVVRSESTLTCVVCHKLYGYFSPTIVTINNIVPPCPAPSPEPSGMPDHSTEPPFNPQCGDCEVGIVRLFGSSQRCEHCHKVYGYTYPPVRPSQGIPLVPSASTTVLDRPTSV